MIDHIESEIGVTNKSKRTNDVICDENILFSQLNIKESILKGLADNGFKYPSPIQIKAIPMGLLGLDLIIQAKSGTGKTCVFSVLALECLTISSKVAQVLIVSPTREIALQTVNVIKAIGKYIEELNCQLFIGGIKVCQDLKNLKNCHIIVGTPGRIKYLIEEEHIQTEFIRLLILDEADMLFTDNFHNTMNFIYNALPMNKQMLTLSATYTNEMVDIITRYMNSPVMLRLTNNETASLLGVKHYYKEIIENLTAQQIFWEKTQTLLDILSSVDFQQCIVFSNYQSMVQDLCDALEMKGWSSAYISGILDQKQRIDIYNKLKNFQCRVLVTTDLTSRGIDADNVNLVVNLDLPWEFETYLHRMGRAGRYGTYGVVISLVTREEKNLLSEIKDKCSINVYQLPKKIPCDLLSNPLNINDENNVIIEKIEKIQGTIVNQNIFSIFENFKKTNDQLESLSNLVVNKKDLEHDTMSFNKIFNRYLNRNNNNNNNNNNIPDNNDNNSQVSSSLNNKRKINIDIYKLIENHINRKSHINNQEQIKDDQIIMKQDSCEMEKVDKLTDEFDRLSQWANYYSEQYQLFSNEIKAKNEELDNLLLTFS